MLLGSLMNCLMLYQETVFAGDLLINDMGAVPGMTIDLPIRISGVNNFDIYSFKANLSYDESIVTGYD